SSLTLREAPASLPVTPETGSRRAREGSGRTGMEAIMKTTRIALAATMLLGLVAGVAQAGGRAHVSILSAPKHVVAGKTYEVAFSVRPEWPMKNRSLEPTVKAVCGD